MFDFFTEGFLWGVVWLMVGWNVLPQPEWARKMWMKASNKVKEFI